jgi:hypothetical protein
VSVLGDGMVPVAVSFAVLGATGSLADVGYVQAARFVPLVLLVLFGGVFADRLPRRGLMMGADIARFASQGVFALLVIAGHTPLWELMGLQAVNGAGAALFAPAATGLLQETVPSPDLQSANSLRTLATSIGEVGGPALAGVLVAVAGAGWAIGVDAISFLISAIALSRIHSHAPHKASAGASVARDLRQGWLEFNSRQWLRLVVGWASLYNLLVAAPFIVLGVGVAHASLGGASAWALILASSGAGAILGGLVGLRFRPRRPLRMASIGMLSAAPPLWLLAEAAPVGAIALAAFIAGIAFAYFACVWETTIQRAIPTDVVSRVSAYDWFGSLAFYPLGQALAAPVATAIGLHLALWLAGAWAAISTLGLLASPALRTIDRVHTADEPQPT